MRGMRTVNENAVQKSRFSRQEIAELLAEYEQQFKIYPSQRMITEELEIPRSKLQHWLERKDSINADPEVVAFFESPSGSAFLHRLVLGAHFVMTHTGSCSVRHVCQYLELTGLNRFVASSYRPQCKVATRMEAAVAEFGAAETQRLAEGMEKKAITICQDETFPAG